MISAILLVNGLWVATLVLCVFPLPVAALVAMGALSIVQAVVLSFGLSLLLFLTHRSWFMAMALLNWPPVAPEEIEAEFVLEAGGRRVDEGPAPIFGDPPRLLWATPWGALIHGAWGVGLGVMVRLLLEAAA